MSPQRLFGGKVPWVWTKVVLVNLPLTLLIILVVNARTDADRHHAERLLALEHNAIVCITVPYAKGQLARAQFNARHGTTPAARATAEQAATGAEQFLAGLVTIPPSFDCQPLLKKLLDEARERKQKSQEALRDHS